MTLLEPSSPAHAELQSKRQRLVLEAACTGCVQTPSPEGERRPQAGTATQASPAGGEPGYQGHQATPAPGAVAGSQVCQQQAAWSEEQITQLRWLSQLHMELQRWLGVLRDLDPVLQLIPCEASVLALGIFRRYWERYPQRTGQYMDIVTVAALACSLWVAIKFLVHTGAVPNSVWVASATAVPSKLIVKLEPEVLRAVDWDVLAVCKSVGLCLPAPIQQKE